MNLAEIGQQSATNWSTDTDSDDDSDSDSVTVRSDGTIEVELDDTDVDRAENLARQRNQSYQSGATTDDNWAGSKSGGDIHVQGLLAELAMEEVYGVPVDESISAAGDGGLDGELEIDGETLTYDIKSSDYDGPGQSLMAKKENVEKRSSHPDVYVRAYVDVDTGYVEINGWIRYEDLVDESNIKESPASWLDHLNYDVSVRDLNEPWSPTNR
ncbi:hypothetical protein [Natronoglomus mannanivorans]|uniref:Uncharacterized protein n=1 Tax=Natronoglomus mannanivorans TaxID=2979990 RepID=A0AAP2Z4L3_9EURY|nr:hypothetical protein [Halobacteria archaeon AArc-xg1-1]